MHRPPGPPLTPGRAWWSRAALDDAVREASRAYPIETGGVLLGWFAGAAEAVVTHALGPGPGAVHARKSFRPDHEWQQQRIDEAYAASGRTVGYLGDWHTHPDGGAGLSPTDLRTLRRIAGERGARASRPIMAVLAGGPDWELSVRQLPRRTARRTRAMSIAVYTDDVPRHARDLPSPG